MQKKRHEALQNARRQEKMAKSKEDRRIRQEIVRVSRGVHGMSTLKKKKKKTRRRRRTPKTSSSSGGHFFMTSVDDDSTYGAGPATPELNEY